MKNNCYKKGIVLGIIVLFISVYIIPSTANIVVENNLLPELIIDGPKWGKPGETLEYTLLLTDQEECDIWYYVDWDDGTNTSWLGPYASGEEVIVHHAWEGGYYTISAAAIGCNDTYYYATLEVAINSPPDPPYISGPTNGHPGVEYDYTIIPLDIDDDWMWLYIDWDDGTFEEWWGPFDSGEEVIVSHSWSENRTYIIGAKAKDVFHESYWSWHEVKIGNEPPSVPDIDGEKGIVPGVEFDYYFRAIDPEGDDVRYIIDWGDGNLDTTDFYSSGEEVTIGHTYEKKCNYGIEAKAIDIYGAEGDWGYYIPEWKNKPINSLLLRFLERYPLLNRFLTLLIN